MLLQSWSKYPFILNGHSLVMKLEFILLFLSPSRHQRLSFDSTIPILPEPVYPEPKPASHDRKVRFSGESQ
jgi:hypothetical protein